MPGETLGKFWIGVWKVATFPLKALWTVLRSSNAKRATHWVSFKYWIRANYLFPIYVLAAVLSPFGFCC